jgi:hypothetical protein
MVLDLNFYILNLIYVELKITRKNTFFNVDLAAIFITKKFIFKKYLGLISV